MLARMPSAPQPPPPTTCATPPPGTHRASAMQVTPRDSNSEVEFPVWMAGLQFMAFRRHTWVHDSPGLPKKYLLVGWARPTTASAAHRTTTTPRIFLHPTMPNDQMRSAAQHYTAPVPLLAATRSNNQHHCFVKGSPCHCRHPMVSGSACAAKVRSGHGICLWS